MGRVWPRHGHRGRPLNSVVRLHMNSDAPICPKCGIPMRVAQIPFVARFGTFVLFVVVAMSIFASLIIGAVALGVPNEGVDAMVAILAGVYVIARLRLTAALRGPGHPPLYICDKCKRHFKGEPNVQSNNALERTVMHSGPRLPAAKASGSAAQLGR